MDVFFLNTLSCTHDYLKHLQIKDVMQQTLQYTFRFSHFGTLQLVTIKGYIVSH